MDWQRVPQAWSSSRKTPVAETVIGTSDDAHRCVGRSESARAGVGSKLTVVCQICQCLPSQTHSSTVCRHDNKERYLSVNSPELIFDLVNAKPGTNHSLALTLVTVSGNYNPTNPTNTINSGELTDKNPRNPFVELWLHNFTWLEMMCGVDMTGRMAKAFGTTLDEEVDLLSRPCSVSVDHGERESGYCSRQLQSESVAAALWFMLSFLT